MGDRRGNAGYTLLEVIVALLIMLTLGGVVYAVLLTSTGQIARWRRELTLEDQLHLIMRRLAEDLTCADRLSPVDEHSWSLAFGSKSVVYSRRDGVLVRNGHRMHDATLTAVSFGLKPDDAVQQVSRRRPGPAVVDGGAGRPGLRAVAVRVALRSRERVLALETSVAMRQHRPWEALSGAGDAAAPRTGTNRHP